MAEAAEKIDETTEETQEEALQPLTEARFGLEVEASNRWRATIPMGVDPEKILKDESYWRHIARYLRPGDEIVCMPDDMAWKLIVHVHGSGRLYAHVSKEEFYELTSLEAEVKVPSIYEVKFAGTHHKWAVLRKGKHLKDGFETEAIARRYAQNHEAASQR